MFLFQALARTLLDQAHAWRMLCSTTASFAFSIAVILGTVGLMDGFELILKRGLRAASGDLTLTSTQGFFDHSSSLKSQLKNLSVKASAGIVTTEGFVLADEQSRGVMVKGIVPEDFHRVTGLKVRVHAGEGAIGQALAREWELQKGDELVIALARGNQAQSSMPLLKRIVISDIVSHGVYEKDLRTVYVDRGELQEELRLYGKVNQVLLAMNAEQELSPVEIKRVIRNMHAGLDASFIVRPYWQEFASLLEAVEVEKVSISFVMQLIVLVAIFNIAAFMIYLSEKKSREFFLLRALGLKLSGLMWFWSGVLLALWGIACGLAILLAHIFDLILRYTPWLEIPGDIYVLNRLSLHLDNSAYILVFGLSLLWIQGLAIVGWWRLKRRPLLAGLRQEFQ